MTRRTLIASLIFCVSSLLLAALLSLSSGRASGSSNLLQNPGFEEGTDDWRVDRDTTQFNTVTEPVHSGQWAASLNKTDGVVGEIYFSQDVEGIIGDMPYALSGWAYKNDPRFSYVKLRIEWKDAALQTVRDDESHILTEDEDTYHLLCIPRECDGTGVRAPARAVKARIKCVAHIQEPNPATPVFFDDLSFTFQGWRVYAPLVVKNH